MPPMAADRWLHLRSSAPWSAEMFDRFRSGCRLWQAHVQAVCREPCADLGAADYEFFEPVLSGDRLVATLPVGGPWTLGSRSKFENIASYLLREFLPHEFCRDLEEGLTEPDASDPTKNSTSWRKPSEPIARAVARALPFAPSGNAASGRKAPAEDTRPGLLEQVFSRDGRSRADICRRDDGLLQVEAYRRTEEDVGTGAPVVLWVPVRDVAHLADDLLAARRIAAELVE
jgi:hypothetical protein